MASRAIQYSVDYMKRWQSWSSHCISTDNRRCGSLWAVITIYLLRPSRDRRPPPLRRRAPGWTCRRRAPRGEPPCAPGAPARCWWRWRSRRSPTRSCLGAARSGSRTCSAGGWTGLRSARSLASWRAGPGRPQACFSGAGWAESWGTACFLFSGPWSAVCRPCSKSLTEDLWIRGTCVKSVLLCSLTCRSNGGISQNIVKDDTTRLSHVVWLKHIFR